MQDAATATWKATTKRLTERLAKERKITPSDLMTLMRFAIQGEAVLREEQEPERVEVAS
jgi:hypothetical protein